MAPGSLSSQTALPLSIFLFPSITMKSEFRSHYPQEWQEKSTIPYHNIVEVNEQVYREPLTFNYTIKTTLHRQHFNPPIWWDCHFHNFEISLELQAVRQPEDLYGLDMVEMENQLQVWAKQLPEIINDHPLCPHGTTEEMCLYISQIPIDSHIQILRVSVSETPNRVTTLPVYKP